jgi:hypothetical protein
MTHSEIVEYVAVWLLAGGVYDPIATEIKGGSVGIEPDVVAWDRAGMSIVVECKVSLSDLRAQGRKPLHRDNVMPGTFRYIAAPEAMATAAMCSPIADGHGVLSVSDGGRVTVVRWSPVRPTTERELREERSWLLALLRQRSERRRGNSKLVPRP